MARLTEAQRRLLGRVALGSVPVKPNSQPVRALRCLGYVDFDDQAGRGLWWLVITEAGRRALSHKEGGS